MEYLLLCTLWVIWCSLHSFFTNTKTTAWFKNYLGNKFTFYRLSYNLFSLATVLPLLYWQGNIPGPVLVPLSPVLKIFKLMAVVSALAIVAGSFLSFDIKEFLGIKQITGKVQEDTVPVISKHGFYGMVRHPIYLGGFLLFIILMTDVPLAQFLGYLILAAYVVIGTFREDRRLAVEIGSPYRDYQKEVPIFLPRLRRK